MTTPLKAFSSAQRAVLALGMTLIACGGATKGRDSCEDAASKQPGDPAALSALMEAIFKDDKTEVKRLLDGGTELSHPDQDGLTPLILASYLGRDEIVGQLINHRADANLVMKDGTSALMLAAMGNHQAVARRLTGAGADLDKQTTEGVSALMLATIRDHGDMVDLLLSEGADPNLQDGFGDTAVVGAAAAGKMSALASLLERVEKLEKTDRAVTEACIAGNAVAFTLLVDRGVSVDSRGREGWTCLMLAAWKGHINVVNAALGRGADVSAEDEQGWNALMAASSVGDEDIVALFLEKGADPRRKNAEGRDAISLAESNLDPAVAELLWKAAGLPAKELSPPATTRDLSTPLECPGAAAVQAEMSDLAAFTTPIIWKPSEAGRRWGRGWRLFSSVLSSKEVPVEVCRPEGETSYLMDLTCDDGKSPFFDPEQAKEARAGSVGQGGRCGKIIDLYIVHCAEASYKVYMDMYHCTPFD